MRVVFSAEWFAHNIALFYVILFYIEAINKQSYR